MSLKNVKFMSPLPPSDVLDFQTGHKPQAIPTTRTTYRFAPCVSSMYKLAVPDALEPSSSVQWRLGGGLNFLSIAEGLRQTVRRPARFQRNNHTSPATVTAVVNQDTRMPFPQMYAYSFAKRCAY
jgi:hypothetical protein